MTSPPATGRLPRAAVLGQLPRMPLPDGTAIRALLVDDDRALTNLIRMALKYEGWEIDVAHGAGEALVRYRENTPDIVVLDIMLPTPTAWAS
jgi:two-component system response regulator TrcR